MPPALPWFDRLNLVRRTLKSICESTIARILSNSSTSPPSSVLSSRCWLIFKMESEMMNNTRLPSEKNQSRIRSVHYSYLAEP